MNDYTGVDPQVLEIMSSSIEIMKEPPIKDSLDKEELFSPLPDFSTIENIKSLSITQVFMAFQIFMNRLDFNYDMYRDNEKLRIFGGTDKPIPVNPHYPEILNANIPQIMVLFYIFRDEEPKSLDKETENLLESYRCDHTSINLLMISTMIRNFLIRASNVWDRTIKDSSLKNNDQFYYIYDLYQYYFLNRIPQKLLQHPIFSYCFFDDQGWLRRNIFLDFRLGLNKFYIKYYYDNDVDVSQFFNKMLQSITLEDCDITKQEEYLNFIQQYSNIVLLTKYIQPPLNELVLETNLKLLEIPKNLNIRRRYEFDYSFVYEIINPKISTLENMNPLILFLKDYFIDFYNYLKDSIKDNKELLYNSYYGEIHKFFHAIFMAHFLQVIVYYLRILEDKDDALPLSWFFEQNAYQLKVPIPVSIYIDEDNLKIMDRFLSLFNKPNSPYEFFIQYS